MTAEFKERWPGIGYACVPAGVVNPDYSQIRQWRWFESEGRHFMCYWDGGAMVDMYGPFKEQSQQFADDLKAKAEDSK
jgi:hypothetical protein